MKAFIDTLWVIVCAYLIYSLASGVLDAFSAANHCSKEHARLLQVESSCEDLRASCIQAILPRCSSETDQEACIEKICGTLAK